MGQCSKWRGLLVGLAFEVAKDDRRTVLVGKASEFFVQQWPEIKLKRIIGRCSDRLDFVDPLLTVL